MGSCSSWLSCNLFSLLITLLVFLPIISAVKCFSNTQKFQTEEECGPNGYCFSFNGSDQLSYSKTLRGCDNSFICEIMISNITQDKKYPVGKRIKNIFGFTNYCASNVNIHPIQEKYYLNGKLCCCNEDWCNVNYANEPINDLSRILDLDSGTATDYAILKNIASKYGIQ
ncbi:unnamed protein product [Onchocerca flexuosa]|uniref:Activin_recp domain-containing protein n=1 Tax=Onchocerca flexuosa TaxID=387005 RepID=A0A183HMM1_9BILA|nr:unnamed protein product [Onchocerca flexuosa]